MCIGPFAAKVPPTPPVPAVEPIPPAPTLSNADTAGKMAVVRADARKRAALASARQSTDRTGGLEGPASGLKTVLGA